MGNILHSNSNGTKRSNTSIPPNRILKAEAKPNPIGPNDAEVDKCKSRRKSDDGNLARRPYTASSVIVQVSHLQERSGSARHERPNKQGPSHSRNDEQDKEEIVSDNREPCTEDSHRKPTKNFTRKYKIQELEACLNRLTEERNILLNRLSEIGAMSLTNNNPNITDLSDANMPSKSVDQLSELFDNEWTDAYEHLTKTQGQTMVQSVNLLLQILKESYNTCLSSTKEREIRNRNAMLSYLGLPDEDSVEIELQEIEKKMYEYRMKKSQSSVTRVGKEVRERLRGQFKHLETEKSNSLSLYIDGCVRICWYMCIKNPPMHLDFGENDNKTTTDNATSVMRYFNQTKFVSYTKQGEYIDYVVWPAVFLHDGGPIMKKGVAQGAPVITNMLINITG